MVTPIALIQVRSNGVTLSWRNQVGVELAALVHSAEGHREGAANSARRNGFAPTVFSMADGSRPYTVAGAAGEGNGGILARTYSTAR